jgi:hypothetical protein
MSSLNAKLCANCAYLFIDKDAQDAALAANLRSPDMGICRRFPPVPLLVPVQNGLTVLPASPPVKLDAFCGEFRQRLQPLVFEPAS